MELKEQLQKAIDELRKEKKRNFEQTIDLIVNLQKFDAKKKNLNFFISMPHKIKDKKVASFLDVKSDLIETITPDMFGKYKDKKELKKLVRKFDFFIAQASLMPKVATVFGRVLGPAGKMPSPQLGILPNPDDKLIQNTINKINHSIKIRTKELSIKLAIGKEKMQDQKIIENVLAVYNALLKELPRNKENIKNIEIKFTMTKPQKIKIR